MKNKSKPHWPISQSNMNIGSVQRAPFMFPSSVVYILSLHHWPIFLFRFMFRCSALSPAARRPTSAASRPPTVRPLSGRLAPMGPMGPHENISSAPWALQGLWNNNDDRNNYTGHLSILYSFHISDRSASLNLVVYSSMIQIDLIWAQACMFSICSFISSWDVQLLVRSRLRLLETMFSCISYAFVISLSLSLSLSPSRYIYNIYIYISWNPWAIYIHIMFAMNSEQNFYMQAPKTFASFDIVFMMRLGW